MNPRRILLVLALAAVLALASIGWLVPLSRDSQAAPAPSSDAPFKGKVLLVNTNNMMTSAFLLEKAHMQKIGDHSFLVGKGTADGRMGGWYKDRTVRLQMEHVVSITEFDDVKEAKKAMESGGAMGIWGYAAPAATAVPVEVAPPGAALEPPPAPAVPVPPGKQKR
jgi:hypothetical protein